MASFNEDANRILICPLVSHARAITLATLLAHELGHVVDLCNPAFPQPPELAAYPFREIHVCSSRVRSEPGSVRPPGSPPTCERDSEIFADYFSALLTARTLRTDEFDNDPVAAALEYDSFRLINVCSPHEGYDHYIPPMLQSGLAQRIMGCSGFEELTVCPGRVTE